MSLTCLRKTKNDYLYFMTMGIKWRIFRRYILLRPFMLLRTLQLSLSLYDFRRQFKVFSQSLGPVVVVNFIDRLTAILKVWTFITNAQRFSKYVFYGKDAEFLGPNFCHKGFPWYHVDSWFNISKNVIMSIDEGDTYIVLKVADSVWKTQCAEVRNIWKEKGK